VTLVAWMWWRVANARVTDDAMIDGVVPLAAVTTFMVCSPLLSPQYMVWLLPIAALTDSAELRRTITVASGAALALYAFPSALLQHGNHRLFWSALRLSVAFEVPIGFWAWELISLA